MLTGVEWNVTSCRLCWCHVPSRRHVARMQANLLHEYHRCRNPFLQLWIGAFVVSIRLIASTWPAEPIHRILGGLWLGREQGTGLYCYGMISLQITYRLTYTASLTHLPLDKLATILQTIFSKAYSCMKSLAFWLKFHWSLFLRVQLTITQHSFG